MHHVQICVELSDLLSRDRPIVSARIARGLREFNPQLTGSTPPYSGKPQPSRGGGVAARNPLGHITGNEWVAYYHTSIINHASQV